MDEKLVNFEPAWHVRHLDRFLFSNPPDGYRFVNLFSREERRVARAKPSNSSVQGLISYAPVGLINAFYLSGQSISGRTDFTYSLSHLVFRDEPWFLDINCEQPHLLVGSWPTFVPLRGLVRQALESARCKAIVCRADAVRRALLQLTGSKIVAKKSVVIYSSSPSRQRSKQGGDINLLFIDSINTSLPYSFYGKGGLILLDAFTELSK